MILSGERLRKPTSLHRLCGIGKDSVKVLSNAFPLNANIPIKISTGKIHLNFTIIFQFPSLQKGTLFLKQFRLLYKRDLHNWWSWIVIVSIHFKISTQINCNFQTHFRLDFLTWISTWNKLILLVRYLHLFIKKGCKEWNYITKLG